MPSLVLHMLLTEESFALHRGSDCASRVTDTTRWSSPGGGKPTARIDRAELVTPGILKRTDFRLRTKCRDPGHCRLTHAMKDSVFQLDASCVTTSWSRSDTTHEPERHRWQVFGVASLLLTAAAFVLVAILAVNYFRHRDDLAAQSWEVVAKRLERLDTPQD